MIFARRDSDMCVRPIAHRNNGRKAVYEELDCERKKNSMLKCFLAWETFLSCCSSGKKLRRYLFLQFYFDVSPGNIRPGFIKKQRLSVQNQLRVRAAKK